MKDYLFKGTKEVVQKQLRSSKATVTAYWNDVIIEHLLLTSYSTNVVIVDCINNVIYLSAWFDCSMTTMRQVHKFFADYMDMRIDIPTLRKADTIGKWTIKRVRKIEFDWVNTWKL